MAAPKDIAGIPCTIVKDGESFHTSYEHLLRALSIQAYVESHGRNSAVRQLLNVWRHQWSLSDDQVRLYLEVVSTLSPLE